MVWPSSGWGSAISQDIRLRYNNKSTWLVGSGDEKPSGILFHNHDLFLAQQIEVGMAAGTRIDDGGKVPREIVGVSAEVTNGEHKG